MNPNPRRQFQHTLLAAVLPLMWLWGETGSSAIENRIGSGRLVWGKTARQVLDELGAPPDFEHRGLSDAGTIDWIHRTMSDGTEIYFVTSRWENPESVTCSFRVSGKQPELWNPVTGERRDATAFRQENGRALVLLDFDPCGSRFMARNSRSRKPLWRSAS